MADEPSKPGGAPGPKADSERMRAKAADFAWLYDPEAQAEVESQAAAAPEKAPAPLLAPETVLCDAGELDDVAALLGRISEPPMRIWPADLHALEPWELPGRMFVTTVRLGFSMQLPPELVRPGVALVAVGDGDTATVTNAMLRRGFHYVVRRPVHPEALRLLFAQLLYRGRDQRRAARFSYGGEVRWRAGFRLGRCHMPEISSEGCRLLLREALPIGRRIVLRVPVERGNERTVKLRGRLVRRDRPRRDLGGAAASVAVAFEGLSERARAELDLVLLACSAGPATARGEQVMRGTAPQAPTHTPLPVRLAARALGAVPSPFAALLRKPEPPAAPAPPPTAGYDRRLAPRVSLGREVVAIDPEEGRVTHTLVGRDLSLGGMSVEPHPLLQPGEKLHVALYGADEGEPLVLLARVVRTDGTRGFGLRFEPAEPDTTKRLASLVAALPSVESLSEDKSKTQGVVLGEIVLKKVKRPLPVIR